MKLQTLWGIITQLLATVLLAVCITSNVEAENVASQQTLGDDPWSKNYVFHFEHDTFYVPAVWLAGSTHSIIPEIDQLHMPPNGSTFKVKDYLVFRPLNPDWRIGSRQTFEEAQAMPFPRLVAGRSFLVYEILLQNNYVEPATLARCPNGAWEFVALTGNFEKNECSINCSVQAFGKTNITLSPDSFCSARHATHLGYRVEYNWDGRYVDPASWEEQDRRVEQLLEWLKTPPIQRPKYLPELPAKAQP